MNILICFSLFTGILVIFFVVFLVVFEYSKMGHANIELKNSPRNFFQFITGITFLIYSYGSNEIVPQVAMCLGNKESRIKNFTKSLCLAMFLMAIFHLVPGIIGYLTFGANVTSNLMKMYETDDWVVILAIFALTFKLTTMYVPFLFCARDTIQEIIFENSGKFYQVHLGKNSLFL